MKGGVVSKFISCPQLGSLRAMKFLLLLINYFTRQSPEWKMLMVFLPCHFSFFSHLTWYVAEPEVVSSAKFFF
jgi:hypothetical protein